MIHRKHAPHTPNMGIKNMTFETIKTACQTAAEYISATPYSDLATERQIASLLYSLETIAALADPPTLDPTTPEARLAIQIWIAESVNGESVQFDTEPSNSDILNGCEDMPRPIRVYEVCGRETHRVEIATITDEESIFDTSLADMLR